MTITIADRAESARDTLARAQIIPLITFTDACVADDVADALLAGGVTAIEVALRSPAAPDALARLGRRNDITVGVGTVITTHEAVMAAELGARFAASPGWDDGVAHKVAELGLLPIPGVATATEVQAASSRGLTFLKLFPAGLAGGTALLSALHGPFPEVRFLASGGISLDNAKEYLRHPAVSAVSGSWIAPGNLIASRAWEAISANARAASNLVLQSEAAE